MKENINRLKLVLAEKKRTNKWLAEHLAKAHATVSIWCTNLVQPVLTTSKRIAELSEEDIRQLLWPTKVVQNEIVYSRD